MDTAEQTEKAPGRLLRRRRSKLTVLCILLATTAAVPFAVHSEESENRRPRPQDSQAQGEPGPLEAAEAMEQARKTGKDVEVEAERTASSTTWAQPDGLLRTRTYSDTVRARTADGWEKIDTDLEKVKGGYAPKAVNDPLLFSAGTSGGHRTQLGTEEVASDTADAVWTPLVTMTTGGHELAVSWPGPLPEPVVNGPRALYENVRPDIDLLLTARDSGYSHVLIVHTPEAAEDPLLEELRYRLASPSLDFRIDETTGTVQALTEDGEEMAASPTPFAWDSAGMRTTGGEAASEAGAASALGLPGLAGPQPGTHDARLEARLGDDDVLSVTPDAALLNAEDTVYPVFVDPSFKGHKQSWTLLYAKYRSSSFWNGQNFNDGTNHARVGYENTTGGLSRSVFNFEHDGSLLKGATVQSATLRLLQTYSWGCSARRYDVWLTSKVTSSHTWDNQPSWSRRLSSLTNGYGYDPSSCPDRWVGMDVKSAAQDAADGGWNVIALGLRAYNESDTYAWKKVRANGENSPYIEITYNRRPDQPTAQTMTPGPDCDLTSPYSSVGKSDLTFRAKGSDPDGNLKDLQFRVWPDGDYGSILVNTYVNVDSNGYASVVLPWENLTNGTTYSWDVRSRDTENAGSAYAPDGSQPCRFVVDHTAPQSPSVTSSDFPADDGTEATWSNVPFGTPGAFTFGSGGSSDVVRYEYSLNWTGFASKATPASPGQSVTIPFTAPLAGPNVLYVRAVDSVGNVSAQTAYRFTVTPRAGLDTPGDVTGDGYPDLLTVTSTGRLKAFPGTSGGDLHAGMDASYTTEGGVTEPTPDGYWDGALITHNGDWLPGDGIQDLVARVDGGLYVYPGDGYSGFDVSRRQEVLLPENAPAPSALTQILSVGDVDADGHPDLFANVGAELWAFGGYSGGSFATAHRLTTGAWDTRDLVLVGDLTGDGTADLIFRTHGGNLWMREGKSDEDGKGTDMLSLGTAASSRTGSDILYGDSGWEPANVPLLVGTPDANGDDVPDIWVMFKSGNVYRYPGGATTHGAPKQVISDAGEGTDWTRPVAIG
ncbi:MULTISPECIES: DNRLRE domain-containing protein [unclassified Streptomyces]|uniref:DNRLRE domain-containing protein n=1 Tax=unclassified Streptomyces TaxID=2593676 RepID=UPI0022B6DF89|nr:MULTISPECIES: DNRLRE domain-containing protein [unclassified Streptomyces]MCZ7416927.1 DNRLRE domain-containing protein [Streptomyces sp. WMMC897]MCZ7433243.1 DNRLRE domain-containing protein [Streptomyces sp. WMMC1477]